VKTDGSKELFDREKLLRSMKIALRKRPVDDERIEQVLNSLVRQLESLGETEVPTAKVGELVMETLRTLDHVAYVRYASVYRDFRSPADFNEFVDTLKRETA
jgi:transcriptional repressor NrdR